MIHYDLCADTGAEGGAYRRGDEEIKKVQKAFPPPRLAADIVNYELRVSWTSPPDFTKNGANEVLARGLDSRRNLLPPSESGLSLRWQAAYLGRAKELINMYAPPVSPHGWRRVRSIVEWAKGTKQKKTKGPNAFVTPEQWIKDYQLWEQLQGASKRHGQDGV